MMGMPRSSLANYNPAKGFWTQASVLVPGGLAPRRLRPGGDFWPMGLPRAWGSLFLRVEAGSRQC